MTLDASDLDQHMGVPMPPGELKEPVATNDIRRWVQGMHYPNPLHYDERWAAESRFGEIVAPHSFTVVRHAHQTPAAEFDVNLQSFRARVQSVFQQLFDD